MQDIIRAWDLSAGAVYPNGSNSAPRQHPCRELLFVNCWSLESCSDARTAASAHPRKGQRRSLPEARDTVTVDAQEYKDINTDCCVRGCMAPNIFASKVHLLIDTCCFWLDLAKD
jgi:hypothetical protein